MMHRQEVYSSRSSSSSGSISIISSSPPATTMRSASRTSLKVLAWSTTLLLVCYYVGVADACHPFLQLHCEGRYDASDFAKLSRVCEDCYNLYYEPELHSLCRKNCFDNRYFEGCIETLTLDADKQKYIDMIIRMGK